MCSPVMSSAPPPPPPASQSPVHCSQFKAVATVRRTNSKRPHRNLVKEFDSQRDMFAVDSLGDSPAPSPKRSREANSDAAADVGPTQMISDASQTVCETQEIEDGSREVFQQSCLSSQFALQC